MADAVRCWYVSHRQPIAVHLVNQLFISTERLEGVLMFKSASLLGLGINTEYSCILGPVR